MEDVDENVMYIDLYDVQIISLIGETSGCILDHLEDTWGYEEVDDDNFYGLTDVLTCTDHSLSIVLMFVKEKFNPGLLAHECFHAMELINANLLINDSEASAYLLDYLVNQLSIIHKSHLLEWFNKQT